MGLELTTERQPPITSEGTLPTAPHCLQGHFPVGVDIHGDLSELYSQGAQWVEHTAQMWKSYYSNHSVT